MKDNKHTGELGWLEGKATEKSSLPVETYMRTVKSAELLDCILDGEYEQFVERYSGDDDNVKMKSFWEMTYLVTHVVKSPADEDAMRIFIAKKNNVGSEEFSDVSEISEKTEKSLKEAMQIDFNFHDFINKKCPLEKLEALMSYNISAVDFYSVYALVEDALPGKSIALSEQSFKEFSWAVDTIRAMLHKLCTPKQAFDYFYEGLKDLRRDVV